MTSFLRQGSDGRTRSFGDIAKSLVRQKKFREKGKFGALTDAWAKLVGEAIAGRSCIRAFKEGVLVVELDSAALLHEMSSFMREKLLFGLQGTDAGRDVAEIRLCLGGGRGPSKSGRTRN